MTRTEAPNVLYVELTTKQRETLDLLIKHNTSKEISRQLGISPHTVDQRIEAIKRKFGVYSRGALAQAYTRHLQTYEQLTYEEIPIAESDLSTDQSDLDQPEPKSSQIHPERVEQPASNQGLSSYQVGLEVFHGRYATIYRIAAIFAISAFLVIVILGGISIFSEMSQIMSE